MHFKNLAWNINSKRQNDLLLCNVEGTYLTWKEVKFNWEDIMIQETDIEKQYK